MELFEFYSKAAEAAVLGSMIIDPGCIPSVIGILPDDEAFYLPEHRTIYDELTHLYFEKGTVDGLLVREALAKSTDIGVEYLQEIIGTVPSAANAVYYSNVVREKYLERQLSTVGERISAMANEPRDVAEKVQEAKDIVLALEDNKRSDIVTSKDATRAATDLRDEEHSFLPTGFKNIDWIISGFSPGSFVIIAGRPSMGKSALALDIALNVPVGVLYISLEMPAKDLLQRAACSRAKVSLARARAKLLTSEEWDAVYDASFTIADKTQLVIDTCCDTPEKQIALIRRLRKTHDIGLVIIDYLQLTNSGRRVENRQQEITTVCRKLKLAAMQEAIPIICLSQLNRQVESRTEHRPRLSDLRESGSIEQDSDVVLLLHREDYYRRSEDPQAQMDGLAEVHIAKHRNGPTGVAKLVFFADEIRFANLMETKE